MQWKPARNAKFAMDEGKIGLKKLKSKVTGGLDGRQPGVETGTFSLYSCSVFGNHNLLSVKSRTRFSY